MSGAGYALTPSAKADLEEIWCYIAEDNPEEADKLEADIYAACETLVMHPGIGNKRPNWTNKPVRFWPVRRNYLVVYVSESVPLEILRIFNAARDVPKLMGEL